ncbi:Tubulin beta chain [Fusarium oxysporum f. sp. albedinis]|nr:Tubulin beta chain [Fusarium oxysporum f. sp. albedinis]
MHTIRQCNHSRPDRSRPICRNSPPTDSSMSQLKPSLVESAEKGKRPPLRREWLDSLISTGPRDHAHAVDGASVRHHSIEGSESV